MNSTPPTYGEFDREAVKAQLGREPRGRWGVARRCRCGKPQVIQTHPRLDDGTPFPTLWWLTCRKLSSEVGGLESSGWMAKLNQRLSWDKEFQAALAEATHSYIKTRDGLEQLGTSAHPGGGPDHIKCLHAHTAHYLVTGDNPAGEEVLATLGWEEPESPCV